MKGTGFRLNPLHCGAVVASGGGAGAHGRRRPVLIPFIAGQWSLRDDGIVFSVTPRPS